MAEERAPGLAIASAVVGRVDLGPATVSVSEDQLTIVLSSAEAWDPPLRLRLEAIVSVVRDPTGVVVTMRDGSRVFLVAADADVLARTIMNGCRALPELTRALRAMGSRRLAYRADEHAIEDEARYFAPLLSARRAAAHAVTAPEAIAAFGADPLTAELDAVLEAFASARGGDKPARRRAIEAEISEIVEPLRMALLGLGPVAAAANANVDDLGAWRAWTAQLRAIFAVADRVWIALDPVLASAPLAPRAKGRGPKP